MPITLLDIILIAIMLISGLLAMVRGFIREVFSIAAWGLAAVATVWGYPQALPWVKQQIPQEIIAMGVTIGGIFIGTLILVSILTVRISDMILDSKVGALDRSLGFLFGLARGLLITVVAFIFFTWLVQEKSQPDWVKNARSNLLLHSTGQWLISLLPDDPDNTILKRLKHKKQEEVEPSDVPPAPPAGRKT